MKVPANGGIYGSDGPLNLTRIPDVLGQTERFVEAGVLAGLTLNPDFNGENQEGVGIYLHNYKEGRRQSAAAAYLQPVLHRPICALRPLPR